MFTERVITIRRKPEVDLDKIIAERDRYKAELESLYVALDEFIQREQHLDEERIRWKKIIS